jgi:hypothetical protein
MCAVPHEDDVLRRYLLGNLAPDACEGIEKQLFSADRIFWERLRDAEDVLIDDYLWDELRNEERDRFERHFLLSSERRSKMEFARALRVYARSAGLARPRFWQRLRNPIPAPAWAVAAAALLLAVLPGALWQLDTTRTSRGEVSAWLASSAGRLRSPGGEVTRVLVPRDCQLIRLHLDPAAGEYDSYQATLHEVTGNEIWFQGRLTAATTAGRPAITMALPCEVLPAGDYYVRLHGIPASADPVSLNRYDFRLLREE